MIRTMILAGAASLAATSVMAADLPMRADPPPVFTPAPIFTWSGFYAGTHSSYSIGEKQRVTTVGNNDNTRENVALGRRAPVLHTEHDGFGKLGGGFGYNWQLSPGSGFVTGVAFDWSWTDVHKHKGYAGPALAQNNFTYDPMYVRQGLDWLGTVHGKLGYAFDRFMVYGLGGFAYGKVSNEAYFFSSPASGFNLAYYGDNGDGFRTGYSYGGGIEYALPPDSFLSFLSIGRYIGLASNTVTLKAEYVRYNLGSERVLVNSGLIPTATGSYTTTFKNEGSLVRAGFSYKFGTN